MTNNNIIRNCIIKINRSKIHKIFKDNNVLKGQQFSHPAFIYKSSGNKIYQFNTKEKILVLTQ